MAASTLDSLNLADGCVNDFGPRKQKQVLLQFLCAVLQELDAEEECDFSEILEDAASQGMDCRSGADLERVLAHSICNTTSLNLDCSALDCYSPDQLSQILVVLVQRLYENFQ